MFQAFRDNRILFLSFSMLMLGTGLQNTLIGLRAVSEGFSSTAIGIIMASFYLGYLFSSLGAARYIAQVGHIRMFAALTALCSITILLHNIFVNPWLWIVIRFLTGLCLSGLYIICESWLNSQTSNHQRGQTMAAYIVTLFASLSIGQLFLYLASPSGYLLFSIASIAISLASIPLLMTQPKTPPISEQQKSINIRRIYRRSPLGTIALFLGNFCNGTIVSLAPIYSVSQGFSNSQAASIVIAVNIGCALLISPWGKLSDLFDRRLILGLISGLCAVCGFVTLLLPHTLPILIAAFFLIGGLALPMTSIAQAYINDWLYQEEMIPAAGTIVLISGSGSVLGPLLAGSLMQYASKDFFLLLIIVVQGFLCAFGLYRMTRRSTDSLHEQSVAYVPAPPNLSPDSLAQTTYSQRQLSFDFHGDDQDESFPGAKEEIS